MEYIKCEKKHKKVRYVNGSAVVEMSYILPLSFLLFLLIIYSVFYYHDKAVLTGAAAETAVTGAQLERKKEKYDMKDFFKERVKGKLIYMTETDIDIQKEKNEIIVSVSAQKSWMKLNICQKAVIVKPEDIIRWMN